MSVESKYLTERDLEEFDRAANERFIEKPHKVSVEPPAQSPVSWAIPPQKSYTPRRTRPDWSVTADSPIQDTAHLLELLVFRYPGRTRQAARHLKWLKKKAWEHFRYVPPGGWGV